MNNNLRDFTLHKFRIDYKKNDKTFAYFSVGCEACKNRTNLLLRVHVNVMQCSSTNILCCYRRQDTNGPYLSTEIKLFTILELAKVLHIFQELTIHKTVY